MNKLTALAFTLAFSIGGVSTSFASSTNQAPQVKDLSAQEMISTVGASRIYWTAKSQQGANVFQADRDGHSAWIPFGRWTDIGRHNIQTGTRVTVQCQGTGFWQAQFTKPGYSVGIRC